MISRSTKETTGEKKRRTRLPDSDYGFARVRDKAFDAIHGLWAKRKSQGVLVKDVASKIGRDTGWVSKQLRGPGNWTLRTFGELVEALDGEAEIAVFGLEEPVISRSNYDAYSIYTNKTVNVSGVAKITNRNTTLVTHRVITVPVSASSKVKLEFTS